MTFSSSDSVTFDDSVRALLDGRNLAGVAVLGADGAPRNSLVGSIVVWINREDDTELCSSTDRRQRARHLRHDTRIRVVPWKIVGFRA
ncbi:pyridoxamine 5'-phosphate oxidase family protein [Streptomyces cellulosae]|uniref:Pyridoxamine 5'-phosphate oxidase putative domain-containing protein n=1 Tax=Streptomyces cellulosae TaxID=1968 RepID=A0ABW7Y0U9_STRCE